MRKQTKLWTCKDRTQLRICDMNDDHLVNTIRFLERYSRHKHNYELLQLCAANPYGEAAQDCIDGAINSMEEFGDDPFEISLYKELIMDAERRGLNIVRYGGNGND